MDAAGIKMKDTFNWF